MLERPWRIRRPRALAFVVLLTLFANGAQAAVDEDELFAKPWVEGEVTLPRDTGLTDPIEIDAGPTSRSKVLVDRATLSVGADGVVRYVLQVRTQGGAVNTTYEGIRCSSREHRVYATGRRDGTWAAARRDDWARIEFRTINAFSHLLYKYYFCPLGVMVRDRDEALMALRRGGHPDAAREY